MDDDKMILPSFTPVDIPMTAVVQIRKTKFASAIVKDGKAGLKAMAKGFAYEPRVEIFYPHNMSGDAVCVARSLFKID